jgi:hypothetical protein
VSHVEAKPVKCRCGHQFCFACGERWHDPVRSVLFTLDFRLLFFIFRGLYFFVTNRNQLGGETPSRIRAWSLIRNKKPIVLFERRCHVTENLRRIIGKKWRAEEEERHTPPPQKISRNQCYSQGDQRTCERSPNPFLP